MVMRVDRAAMHCIAWSSTAHCRQKPIYRQGWSDLVKLIDKEYLATLQVTLATMHVIIFL